MVSFLLTQIHVSVQVEIHITLLLAAILYWLKQIRIFPHFIRIEEPASLFFLPDP